MQFLLRVFYCICFSVCFPVCFCRKSDGFTQGDDEMGNGTLVTVVLVFRHGDRAPIKSYPNDPYRNESIWPVDFGQLTNKGKQQHFELGQWFRRRYANLLPVKYNEKDLYVRSTDVDRTLMSAEANLAGLYYPQENQIWNPNVMWQPIPIHTKPEKEDVILAMKKPCPRYDLLLKELKQSDEIVSILKKNKDLLDYLSLHSGRDVRSLQDVDFLYSVLNIESLYNLTLPNWTKEVFPDKMKPLAALRYEISFAIPCYTKELARLKAGPFIAELLDHLYNTTNSIKHRHPRKLWMYSGHDTTIANVLNTLGLFQPHNPPYTSTVMFELYSVAKKSFYVNIYYKNSSEPMPLTLPGCAFNCPLQKFEKLLESVTLSRDFWDKECQLSLLSYLPFEKYQSVFILSSTGLLVLMLMSLTMGLVCYKHHQGRRQHLSYFRIPDRDERV